MLQIKIHYDSWGPLMVLARVCKKCVFINILDYGRRHKIRGMNIELLAGLVVFSALEKLKKVTIRLDQASVEPLQQEGDAD